MLKVQELEARDKSRDDNHNAAYQQAVLQAQAEQNALQLQHSTHVQQIQESHQEAIRECELAKAMLHNQLSTLKKQPMSRVSLWSA